MKIVITTLAVGESFVQMESKLASQRNELATLVGASYQPIYKIPPIVEQIHPLASFSKKAQLSKFSLAREFQSHDLVIFIDNDVLINPLNFDIQDILEATEKKPLAAVQSVEDHERSMYWKKMWNPNYYSALSEQFQGIEFPLEVNYPDRYINGGFYAFRPKKIMEHFDRCLRVENPLNDDQRINTDLVQKDLVEYLSQKYNTLWYYEKYRKGLLLPETNHFAINRNRVWNRIGPLWGEAKYMLEAYKNTACLHLAFEHFKYNYII